MLMTTNLTYLASPAAANDSLGTGQGTKGSFRVPSAKRVQGPELGSRREERILKSLVPLVDNDKIVY